MKAYLAGPFFNDKQKATMAKAKAVISGYFEVIDPQELGPVIVDVPKEERTPEMFRAIFDANIKGLENADILFACIDDRDTGTAFELGYFFAGAGRWSIVTFSGEGHGANVMLSQATGTHLPTLEALEKWLATGWKDDDDKANTTE